MKLAPTTEDRLLSAFLGAGSWSVLGIAIMLTPDPAGHGTHRQLGLGQCTILSLTGYPCPMCGMTTTFTHMAHLQPLQALLTQPFGVVLFLMTAAIAAVAVLEFIRPTGRWRRLLAWLERHELSVAGSMLAGLLGGWVYKLFEMGAVSL